MKKHGILNTEINSLIATLGHSDSVIICDAGLPMPDESKRIDLALTEGIPGVIDTLKAILDEVVIDSVILAEELKTVSPDMHSAILSVLPKVPITYISHTDFKEKSKSCKKIIRTGEFTPYANIFLVCGCAF